jgi:hypothetical protein
MTAHRVGEQRYAYKLWEDDFMKNPAQFVKEVQGIMAIEGMELKEDEVETLKCCAEGKIPSEEIVRDLVIKYTQKL